MPESKQQLAWRQRGRQDAEAGRPARTDFPDGKARTSYWKGYRTVRTEAADKAASG